MRLSRVLQVSKALLDPSRSIGQIPGRMANYGDIMVADAMQELFSEFNVIDCDLNRLTHAFDRFVGLHRVFRYASLGVVDPDFVKHVHRLRPHSPLLDPSHINRWVACLRKFPFVAVRGVESKRILHEFGFDNAEVIGDPALHFARPRVLPKHRRKRIGINLSQHSHFWNNSQAKVTVAYTQLIRTLLKEQWTITLFSTISEDRCLAEEICRNAYSDRVHLHTRMLDPNSWLNAVEGLDVFLGVKLHSVITAFCVYTPAIMVGYQPKCLDFMRTMGMERLHFRRPRHRLAGGTRVHFSPSQPSSLSMMTLMVSSANSSGPFKTSRSCSTFSALGSCSTSGGLLLLRPSGLVSLRP